MIKIKQLGRDRGRLYFNSREEAGQYTEKGEPNGDARRSAIYRKT